MNLPDPLHPAIVHFPIVLLLAGFVLAGLSLWLKKRAMYLATCIVIGLGAVGSSVAVSTGEREGESAWIQSEAGEALIDEHEEWAETTQMYAWISFAVSFGVVLLQKYKTPALVGTGLLCILMLGTTYCVFQTGHLGGKLVYAYGAGVNPGQTNVSSTGWAESEKNHEGSKRKVHDDDD